MQRRQFMATTLGALLGPTALAATSPSELRAHGAARRGDAFKLKYAPHFGMFSHSAGDDLVDQVNFIADEVRVEDRIQ